MGVILREFADPHHAVQRTGRLVAMALAKLGESTGQVPIARNALFENLHVAGTVHWLDCILAAVDSFGRVHAIAKGIPVP